RAGRHYAGVAPAPTGHAHTADLHEGEPGGPADSLPGIDLAHSAAVDSGRVRRNSRRTADLHDLGSRPGAGARRTEIRSPRADGPARHGGAADWYQRNRNLAEELERQPANWRDRRTATVVHAAGQRATDEG